MKSRPSQQDHKLLDLLEELNSVRADYPPELLLKRRSAFLEKLVRLEKPGTEDSGVPDEEAMVEVLEGLRHVRAKYPPLLLAKRRAAFIDQLEKHHKSGWMETFTSAIRNLSAYLKAGIEIMSSDFYRSFIVVSLLTIVFAGIMIYGTDSGFTSFAGTHFAERGISLPTHVIPTSLSQIKKTSCTPDSDAPPCVAHGFTESPNQTSWVSTTANSWIRLDIGQITGINKVELDRNSSGNPTPDFTISVARSDGAYQEVYDSESDTSLPPVIGMETIEISFEPVLARYVKVTIADPGVVINEVRAFSVNIPPTSIERDEDTDVSQPPIVLPSSTPRPTDTLWPTNTPLPTSTLAPTDTPLPTDTRWPTDTPPLPTDTPEPTDTPLPTDTRWPTDTPLPTDTPGPTDISSDKSPTVSSTP
jgi:hypothetical protein